MLKSTAYFCHHFKKNIRSLEICEKFEILQNCLIIKGINKIWVKNRKQNLQKRPFYNLKGTLSHAKRAPFGMRKGPFGKSGRLHFCIEPT